jgi:uncharacterized membrane protein YphA (DoxX/SURF4 family)
MTDKKMSCCAKLCAWFKHCCGCPKLESLTLLAIRLLLFFPLFEAGWNKFNNFDATVDWFGNADYGLGLPFPVLMAGLAVGAELIGSVLLLLGLFTRLAALPLVVVMLVAAFVVHFSSGWLAIAAEQSLWFGQMEGAAKLAELQQAIQAAGVTNPALLSAYDATLDHGSLAVINGGMEFAITYLLFLLVLVSRGAGLVSLDAIVRRCCKASGASAMCSSGMPSCCDMPAKAMVAPVAKASVVKPAAKPVVKKAATAKKKSSAKKRR